MATTRATVKIADIFVDHEFNSRVMDADNADPTKVELPHADSKEDAGVKPLMDLADSIKADGQITPVLLRRLPKGSEKPYALVAGFRRLTAMAMILGRTEIEAQITDMTEQEAAMVNILENEQRKDLSPFELARTAKRLRDKYGFKLDVVAAKISRSPTHVSNLVRNIEDLHTKILEAWSGKLGPGPRKVCTTDALNKWRILPKDEQLVKFEEAQGLKKDKAAPATAGAEGGEAGEGGETGNGKAPRVKVRSMNDFNHAYEFFASDAPDSISPDNVALVRKVLDWATSRTESLAGYDISEYAKNKAEALKAEKSEFQAFMEDANTQKLLKEAFDKRKKHANATAPGATATPAPSKAEKPSKQS